MKRIESRLAAAGLCLLLASSLTIAQQSSDPLRSGFENPPASARPRVWWHWMNGNITKEGIKLDLDWMHRVGIAGFQNFDAALDTPQVVKQRLAYMTPEWKDAFKYAIQVGDQYGMEMAIAGSPGWSESGGPWVPPQEGMKKYVWSETAVEGGKPFHGTLAHPPTETGSFQDYVRHEYITGGKEFKEPRFYADAAVVAFRQRPGAMVRPRITGSGGALKPALLSDGLATTRTGVKIPDGDQLAWIQFTYPQPVSIYALSFVEPDRGRMQWIAAGTSRPKKNLEASDDGKSWHLVIPIPEDAPTNFEFTFAFPAVTAKYFRVTFQRTIPPGVGHDEAGKPLPVTSNSFELGELALHTDPRVNHWESKADFQLDGKLERYPTPSVPSAEAIAKADVVDLTGKMSADGTLDWTPPPGDWVVLRLGYSLLGVTNHPATEEATGLEVDKMDRRYVRSYFEKYLDSYKDTVGADEMGKKGLTYVINDSYEAGPQNWTDKMLEQFKHLRGYDATPWLPVLTGRVVESAEASDQFLWDFRKTIADLYASEHYGEIETILHEHGMGHYGESHESGRALPADGMEVKKMNEIPMSAMWTDRLGVYPPQYSLSADDRESASVAHIYGQNIAAAESMTAGRDAWAWSPYTLKPTADLEFLNGINRFVIHESAHQPLTDPKKAPGLTLGPYGQWFNRNETWAEQAGTWINYLARTSYLLQQGHFGADIVYFYGEDTNLTSLFEGTEPALPAGYGFDYINADALVHELHAVHGVITTQSGMSYKLLVLDPHSRQMSLAVLRAIGKLAEDGAVVVGQKPVEDASLADDQVEFKKLSDELFGNGTGAHAVGKGKVYAGQKFVGVLEDLGIAPDFATNSGDKADADVKFVHRKLVDGDVYFLDNRSELALNLNAQFRVTGKAPELWYAETGSIKPASFTISGGHTTVPLTLEPWGTVFVVFRKSTAKTSEKLPAAVESQLATVAGPWTIAFQPDRGAPASITVDKLGSWTKSADTGVKYFSGIGTYTKTLDAPAGWFTKGDKLILDLGDVKNLAEVMVNGKSLGVVWHAPYRVDVTSVLKPGANEVTIKVINAWVNRIIGDLQPGAAKYTFTVIRPYGADSPLLPSGLIGPVSIVEEETK